MDFIHFIIVLATVTAADGSQHHEVQAAQRRGFSEAECRAAVTTRPIGSRTPGGDIVIGSGCIGPAKQPAPASQVQPDHKNKSAI